MQDALSLEPVLGGWVVAALHASALTPSPGVLELRLPTGMSQGLVISSAFSLPPW